MPNVLEVPINNLNSNNYFLNDNYWQQYWPDTNPNPYYNYFYTFSNTIYKYQIKCPSCDTTNWLELDKITDCIDCKSKLKAVSAKADHEIQVS